MDRKKLFNPWPMLEFRDLALLIVGNDLQIPCSSFMGRITWDSGRGRVRGLS